MTILVPPSAIDGNGHVNNVAYVQWMQDIAIRHWSHLGGEAVIKDLQATWVARSHKIEYLRPAFLGDELELATWIADAGRVRSRRKYVFRRASEDAAIARGETDWVFVDARTFRPRAITPEVRAIFPPGIPDA